MAWENWSKRNLPQGNNNDEPTSKHIDARGVLDTDYHSYLGSKLFNGLIRVPKNQLYNIAGAIGTAARSDSHVMDEVYNDLPEDSNLWDALGGEKGWAGAKAAVQDVNTTIIRPTVNSTLYDASRTVEGATKVLPKEWESDVDESALPYWERIAGGVVENAPSLVANAAAYALNPVVGTAVMMGDIAGGTTADLAQKGVDIGDAWKAGAANAAAQQPLEMIGASTIGNLLKGVTPKAILKIGDLPFLKALKGKDERSIRNAIGAAFVNESIPEMAQEIPDEMISYIAEHGTLKGFDYGDMVRNMIDSGLVGGITGGILATPGAIANRNRPPTNSNIAQSNATVENGNMQAEEPDGNMDADNESVDIAGDLLNAIGGQESGGEADRYGAYNADGDAHGKYQITSDTWAANAAAAGVDPNEGMTPENQEKVARYMMNQYVQKYGEDGAIIAWYAGEGVAQAYVNGTLSEEAFTRRQGENGEYPSIKEYLESVQARRGQSGATQTVRSASQTNEPQPKSAAEFLKEIENTMPLDTEEQQAESDRVQNTLAQGTQEEQEALAREYGWGQEPAKIVSTSVEGGGQGNTQPVHANANSPANNALQAKVKPIETAGTQEGATHDKGSGIRPVYTPRRNTAANENERDATSADKQNGVPFIAQETRPPAQGAGNEMGRLGDDLQEPASPLYAQRGVNGIADMQRQMRWKSTNKTNAKQAQRINKALSNSKFKGLVKQAFVDGDATAQNRIAAMNINPEVLEAVKGAVIPNYVPQSGSPNISADRTPQVAKEIPKTGNNIAQQTVTTPPTSEANKTTATANPTNNVPQVAKEIPKTGNNTTPPTADVSANNTSNAGNKATSNDGTRTKGAKGKNNNGAHTKGTKGKNNDGATQKEVKSGKSNTEEQTNENAKEVRELLHQTNDNKNGGTTSEKGGKPEGKGGAPAKTENSVKEEKSGNAPHGGKGAENESSNKETPTKGKLQKDSSAKEALPEKNDESEGKDSEKTETKGTAPQIIADKVAAESDFEAPFDISDEGIAKAEADLAAAFGFDTEEPETSLAKVEPPKAGQKTPKEETAGTAKKASKEEVPYSEETDTIEDFSITGLDTSDEALERYKKELEEAFAKSAHRLNSNPIFDPDIWIPAFKIGAVYMARGVKTLAEFRKNIVAMFGEKIMPWVKSIWEALKKTPKGMKYSDEQLAIAIRFAGSKYFAKASKGNDYTLEQLQADFKKVAKTQANYDKYKDLLPLVHAAVANYQKANETPVGKVEDLNKEEPDYTNQPYENRQAEDTIETERSSVEPKEDKNVSRRVSRPSGTVEMGKSEEGGADGKGKGEDAGGNSTDENRKSGQEHAGNSERAKQAVKGKVQGKPRGASAGNAVEQNVSNGDEAGGTEKPVISKKADKVEADIAKGKVKDARDVPGNSYTLKPVNEIKSKKERVKKNIEAIKLLKKIESENRKATPAEQEILASYSGWGSLTFAFDDRSAEYDEKITNEIKSVLTPEEFKEVKEELITAYYTPHNVIKAMWDIAEKLGFKGGRVLDPSCGTGNFFGLMPASIRAKCTTMLAIEKSSLPARIAAQLYQGKNTRVDNMPFEKFDTGDNFYDLAITNVPFADVYPTDKSIKNTYQIHNYFFAKALQKVRPGGLIMFMTSSTTMDRGHDAEKLRRELSTGTELVGVIRMPSSLFNNVGASVTTDVIVLRKLNEGEQQSGSWDGYINQSDAQWYYTTVDANTGEVTEVRAEGEVNQYFNDHSRNVIGVPTERKRGRWGTRVTDIVVQDDKDMSERLSKAVSDFPTGIYVPRTTTPTNSVQHVREAINVGNVDRNKIVGNIVKGKDGKYGHVVQDRETGEIYIKPYSKGDQDKVEKFIAVKDALDDILEAQVNPETSEEELETKRKKLNETYDDFTGKYGCLNDFANTSLLGDVAQIGRVLALENYTAPKNPGKLLSEKKKAKGIAKKAGIFMERTAYPANREIKITTSADALLSSLRQFGYINMDYMTNALGKSEEELAKELDGKIIKDPVSEQYVPMDEYLSGNVRQKLAFAEEAAKTAPNYIKNIDALKKVIPKDLKLEDIDITLGSPVISVEETQAFVDNLVGVEEAIEISYNPNTAKWTVLRGHNYRAISPQVKLTKYGVETPSPEKSNVYVDDIIDLMLKGTDVASLSSLKPSKDAGKGEVEACQKAQLKAVAIRDAINKELREWISSDEARAKRTVDAYNYKFNATAIRKYDGSFLTFPWLNAAANIHLRSHQVNAVWRTLQNKSVLYAHCVGSGKTWTMQSAGMELKRLGLAHKIVYAVPKNVVKQFEREFYTICPNAKILVLDKDNLPKVPKHIEYDEVPVMEKRGTKMVQVVLPNGRKKVEKKPVSEKEAARRRAIVARRNATMMKIKTEDWDAIIISHKTFENIPVAEGYLKGFLDGEVTKYERALEAAREEKASNKTIRDLQDKLTNLRSRLEELTDQSEKMQLGSDTFETLGIDQLFVDEADLYKNLQFSTTGGHVKGISNDYSARAEDMYLKTQYLLNSPNTHGVAFATGTPISNSIVELYTMCRYMAGHELERLGIDSFDAFAKMFILTGQGETPKQDGTGYEYKNKVLGLRNAPECIKIFRQFADVQTAEDLPYIAQARPKCTYIDVQVDETQWLKKFKREIRERVKAFNPQDPPMRPSNSKDSQDQIALIGEPIMVPDGYLLLSSDFRNASLSPKIIDRNVSDAEGLAKVYACADNVLKEYKGSSDRNGAQLVFCDLSTPDRNPNHFSIYRELKRRLIELGIPEDEIAFVHDATTDEKQAKLFQAVNEGKVRVLVGSTGKMGAGTNMQKKLVASHHLDCPWRPRDMDQRDGRIVRQGNENKEVRIYRYVQKGSYDANLWNTVRNKSTVINQIMHGDPNIRTADIEAVDSDNYFELEKLANADPDQKRYLEVSSRLRTLESAKSVFNATKEQAARVLENAPAEVEKIEGQLSGAKDDVAALRKTPAKSFTITVDGKVYTDSKEANEAMSAVKEKLALDWTRYLAKAGRDVAKMKPIKIGEVRGFEIFANGDNRRFRAGGISSNIELVLKRKFEYPVPTATALGAWTALQTTPSRTVEELERNLKVLKRDINDANSVTGQEFADEQELATLTKEAEILRKRIEEKAEKQAEEDRLAAEEEKIPFVGTEFLSEMDSSPLTFDGLDSFTELINRAFAQSFVAQHPGAKISVESIEGSLGNFPGAKVQFALDKTISGWEAIHEMIAERTDWDLQEKGDRVIVTAKTEEANQLDEGSFLATSEPTTPHTFEQMKSQVMSNFPNATNLVDRENGISFDLPNGTHIEVNFTDDTIAINRSKAQADYGGTLTGDEKALGKIETVERDAIITLTKDNVEEAPSHEAMHLAMGLLNEREHAALFKKYGNEEAICEGMREWKIRRNEGKGTSMGKLMQKISDIAYKLLGLFRETDKNVFRKLESGELWGREADNKAASNVSYLLSPANNVSDFLEQSGGRIGNYLSNKSKAAYGKYELKFKPELHEAKQNPYIRKAGRGGRANGWGAIDWVLNNTVRSASRIKSFAARRVWAMGNAAQQQIERLRGEWTSTFSRAIGNLSATDKEVFSDILWEEDAAQHVFSDEELKARGCNDAVIRAHNKTRTLLGKIYNAVNDTYTRTKVENHYYKTLKGAQRAQKDFAKYPHTEVFRDIKEVTKDGIKQYQVSIRARGNHKITRQMADKEIDALKKDGDCYFIKSEPCVDENDKRLTNDNGEPLSEVTYLQYNKALTNMEGYMPHIFHGIMIIRSYEDSDGTTRNEVVGSAETMDEAIVKADKLQKEMGGDFLLSPKQFSAEGEIESPIFLGDKDYFKLMENLREGFSLSLQEAREAAQARRKGRHVSYTAIKKRKGAKGFETNAIWAIQHHIGSSARYVALDPFKTDAINFFERRFGNYDDDWGSKNREAEWVKGYIDSVLGKPGVLEQTANDLLRLFPMFKDDTRPAKQLASNLTRLTGVLKLGVSPAAGFVNMLQILNCVGYVGAKKTAVGIKRALHPTASDIRILKAAGSDEEVGLVSSDISESQIETTRRSKTLDLANEITKKLLTPFTLAERTIRRATILAAYYDYVEKNKDRIKTPTDLKRLALEHAAIINRKVNFDYSVADAPRIFRALQGTVIGDVALQFQKYGIKELETISDFLPILGKETTTRQKVEFFLPYLLVSGLWNAFPFEDAILALLGMLFDIDDPEKEVKKAMIKWAGNDSTRKAMVDVCNYGAGALAGIDISQRVGLKGATPETSNILKGGPLGSTATQLATAIINGDTNGGLKAISPALGNIYGAAAGYNTDSKGRKTVDYDGWDRAIRALGFRTTREARATDAQSIVYNYKKSKTADREKAREAYFDNPSATNYQKLLNLGYSKNDIKKMKDNKQTTKTSRAQSGLAKDDKKTLKPVFDYVQ